MLPFIAFLGTTELIIVLVIVVLIFGVGKLPDVGRHLGMGIKNFKSELGDDGTTKALEDDAASPTTTVNLAPRDVTHEHDRVER
jgi:sec-independent protein translocase protein TatA